MLKKIGIGLAALVATVPGIYLLFIRPWHQRWGATDEEIQRPMPGDDEVKNPMMSATHAVTVNARPEAIWPWLVQLGQGRGGFYSYDWIENRMGLGISNADRIIPEFQNLKVGDEIPLGPGIGIPVKAIEPNRFLLLVGHDPNIADASWVFGLYSLDETHTRLVERFRSRWSLTPGGIFRLILIDPGAFVMERKMLLGIKQRAERVTAQTSEPVQAKPVVEGPQAK
jgi:hypothetical protein